MALKRAQIRPIVSEKRKITLDFLEAAFMSGSEVTITPVDNYNLTPLSKEEYTYKEPVDTYVIFDERPKPHLLQKFGWYREDAEIVPILAYIPTHLLYKKTTISSGILELEPGERVVPFNNAYDSTLVTTNNRLLQHDGTEYVDITSTLNLADGETIEDLKSGFSGCLLRTSNDRIFTWGQYARDGWQITPPSGTSINITNNTPQEISSTYSDLWSGDAIKSISIASLYGGVYLATESGKLITWGYNNTGQMLVPTTSTLSYVSPADRADQLNLNPGEYVEEVANFDSYKVLLRTNQGRIFKSMYIDSRWRITLSTDTPQSILNEGETFVKFSSSQLDNQLHFTSEGRIIYTNNQLNPYDRTQYYEPLLDSDEYITSVSTPLILEQFKSQQYQPFYAITNKGKLIAAGPILGTTTQVYSHQPQTIDLSNVLDSEFNETITAVTFNRLTFDGVNGKHVTVLHTNTGRVIMYNVIDDVLEPEDLAGVMGLAVENEVLLKGNVMRQLVDTGNSDEYVLQELKITRGALIDVYYDFNPEKHNRFYVADVKTDVVSINYVANLVPYKYDADKEAPEEANPSNNSYLNIDSDEMGL